MLPADPTFLPRVLDQLPGVVYVYDLAQERNVFVTEHWVARFGYSVAETLADERFIAQMFHPDDVPRVLQHFDSLRGPGAEPGAIQYRLRHKEGHYVWMSSVHAPLVCDEDGKPTMIVGHAHDISAQKMAEVAEAESAARFRAVVDSLPDAVFVVGPDASLKLVNDAACTQIGYTRAELLGMKVFEFVPPERHASVRDYLSSKPGSKAGEQAYHIRKDGTHVPVEVVVAAFQLDGEPAYMAVARDISDRVRMEARLREAERMEAIGRLAGAVAHDFNNLLAAILGSASLLQDTTTLDVESQKLLDDICAASDRAADLTRQLLTFGRRQPVRRRAVDLGDAVTRSLGMMRRLLEPNHTVKTTLGADCVVFADRTLVDQVVMNLVLNARDAMPGGGEIRVRVEASADQVLLTVTDTGVGIAAEDLPRVFEPFFTTKHGERGTGIGLATVYGIVTQHGGNVSADSQVGVGSTFRVSLPRYRGEVAEPRAPSHAASARPRTVLVVEDIEVVRMTVRRMLAAEGHIAVEAASISEALQRWSEAGSEIDLVLSDIDLGSQEDGRDLAARLRAERPTLPVLLMSGHGIDASPSDPDDYVYLAKPFDRAALRRAIASIIGSAKSDSRSE